MRKGISRADAFIIVKHLQNNLGIIHQKYTAVNISVGVGISYRARVFAYIIKPAFKFRGTY